MKTYIGTKVIKAKELTLGEYNNLRGWEMPSGEEEKKKGYLVEYLNNPNANRKDYENYTSWSPKDVFEEAYSLLLRDSIGMKRIKAEFNPSEESIVKIIKYKSAELIDLIESLRVEGCTGEKHRLISIAQTNMETAASMFAVKAVFTS